MMPGSFMHRMAPTTCPHVAGNVVVGPGQVRVAVNGDFVLTTANALGVLGCPFQNPVPGGTKPQPCVKVQWGNVSGRVMVMGMPVLLQAGPAPGNGVAQSAEQIPQGPVVIGALFPRTLAT